MSLRKIRKYYRQLVEWWCASVPMVTSLNVGALALNDHNLHRFVREHLDILFDYDQAEANSDLFGRVGRKF